MKTSASSPVSVPARWTTAYGTASNFGQISPSSAHLRSLFPDPDNPTDKLTLMCARLLQAEHAVLHGLPNFWQPRSTFRRIPDGR
jgi:hypothetical protein